MVEPEGRLGNVGGPSFDSIEAESNDFASIEMGDSDRGGGIGFLRTAWNVGGAVEEGEAEYDVESKSSKLSIGGPAGGSEGFRGTGGAGLRGELCCLVVIGAGE